jgi:hypothetical protein
LLAAVRCAADIFSNPVRAVWFLGTSCGSAHTDL